MLRITYTLLLILLLPAILLRYLFKSIKEPLYRQNLRYRLGFLPHQKQSIWIHCVSHGETQAAQSFIKELADSYPQQTIILSTTTATGRALGQQISTKHDNICSVYAPIDLPFCHNAARKRLRPTAVFIFETEIWPNWLLCLKKYNIPAALLNARLSARSAQKYSRIQSSIAEPLSALTTIAVRDQQDFEHFISIGATKQQLSVLGNIKFDQKVPDAQVQLGKQWRQTIFPNSSIWVAASTHAGEEEIMLQTHLKIQEQIPNCLCILVPRHPNRFDEVTELSQHYGFSTLKRTDLANSTTAVDVLIGNSMGELFAYFAASECAVVAGSYSSVGGHNVLEPMALGLPTITGPNNDNFDQIARDAKQENALQIIEARNLAEAIIDILNNPQLNNAALDFVSRHQGAQARVLACAIDIIANAKP